MLLGIDTGGTFTDFVLWDRQRLAIHKVLSTPAAPERAILQGIGELQLDAAMARGELTIVHGSTVATNAALEGKGARTVFITNRGFKDMLSIGRQARRELYNLQPSLTPPPVPEALCLEADCRRDAHGQVVTPLQDEEVTRLAQQVGELQPAAVAINLLYSYLDGGDEDAIAAALPDALFVSRSSRVLPEYKEYERGIVTWLNAYLGPLVYRYLRDLQRAVRPSRLAIMQSSGGTIAAEQGAQRAVNLLLSGPAGGLAASKFIGECCGAPGLMTFDMGGTSTDVALISGELRITNEGKLGDYPVAVPMVDMHTIGAGGGSIAYLDAGGLLQVGPQSAGADPGPACYSKGGSQPTVTDANLILGRLRPDYFLGGSMTLDRKAAQAAMAPLAGHLKLSLPDAALGIIAMANEHMARALRVISVQRGHDPRDFWLCSFGGAGGLHVCALADALGMTRALVPQYGGVLSALGMLVAPRERQLSRTHQQALSEVSVPELETWLDELAGRGRDELAAEGIEAAAIQLEPSLDLRYLGQSYTVNVPCETLDLDALSEAFHRRHETLYGHRLPRVVEVVTVRQRVFAQATSIDLPELPVSSDASPAAQCELFGIGEAPLYQREHLPPGTDLPGPALICETVATTYLAPGWRLRVDVYGNLHLMKA